MVKTASKAESQRALLPFLQQRSPAFIHSSIDLPLAMTIGPDGTHHNTYFFDPVAVAGGAETVGRFCAKDPRSAGEILLAYFHFFAFEFDWRRQVVSIIDGAPVLKEEKAREHGWRRHARLSIEDPFEIGYDVGHVLREETARRLRTELARAYYILAGGTGKTGAPAIEQLLEVYEPPKPKEKDAKGDAAEGTVEAPDAVKSNGKNAKSKRSTPSGNEGVNGKHPGAGAARGKGGCFQAHGGAAVALALSVCTPQCSESGLSAWFPCGCFGTHSLHGSWPQHRTDHAPTALTKLCA